jgi:hypothetical protein
MLEVAMLEITVSDHADARPPGCRRLASILAGVLALLGSFVVTAPAQAGYYDDSSYGYGYRRPCYQDCGYAPPYRYRCSPCGCYRRCYSGWRRPGGYVYERRYVEREYVERRYGGYPHHHYYPYEGYRHYGDYPYGGYRGPFPYGYGGVRSWRAPYGYYRFRPWAEDAADRYYEEPPRPPAPVWDNGEY